MAASLQALACATLLFLLLVLVPHACTAAKTTLLQDSCERYAGGDRSSSDYNYCVSTLLRAAAAANRSAATTDALGLAWIAARYARATARATRARIAALKERNNETTLPRAARDALGTCTKEYAATVRRIGHAKLAMQRAADGSKDGPGYLRRAQNQLAQATGAPARCDEAFAAARQDSPLADGDFGLDDQIELASFLLPRPWLSPPPPATT